LALKSLIIEDDLGPVYPYLWGRLRQVGKAKAAGGGGGKGRIFNVKW
jgi:hypothetical protein